MCLKKQETIDHSLCGCRRSKVICDNIFPHVDKIIMVDNNFADGIIHLATKLSSEDFKKKKCASHFGLFGMIETIFVGTNPIAEWTH